MLCSTGMDMINCLIKISETEKHAFDYTTILYQNCWMLVFPVNRERSISNMVVVTVEGYY